MTTLPPDRMYFRPDEMAQVLALKLRKVYSMIRRGKVFAVRIENEYRIPRAELERLMTRGTRMH